MKPIPKIRIDIVERDHTTGEVPGFFAEVSYPGDRPQWTFRARSTEGSRENQFEVLMEKIQNCVYEVMKGNVPAVDPNYKSPIEITLEQELRECGL